MRAPVVVFAYNRKEHLKRTLEALAANEGADETSLYIYIDAPKEGLQKDSEQVKANEAVKKYVEEFTASGCGKVFADITTEAAQIHRGLADAVIGGVSDVIDRHGTAIVVEDDIVTSPYFLNYMNDALEYYKDNDKVWSISGYTLPLPALKGYDKDVYAFYRCCSWGWATWKDRWVMNDWNVRSFKSFDRNYFKRRRFNRGGRDLSFQLDRQMLDLIDSWAIRWGYNESIHDMVTIYPSASYVDNEGFDGSGTHFGSVSTNYNTTIQGKKNYTFTQPFVDRKIAKQFRDRYSENALKAFIKEVLYCLHLYEVK